MQIEDILSRKILDSRSVWTIETTLKLRDGSTGVASVPDGTSKGASEVVSFPAEKALNSIKKLSPVLIGKVFKNQREFDQFLISLDGTERKERYGGNSILSLSASFSKALAISSGDHLYSYYNKVWGGNKKLKMPKMLFLMFEGSLHGADSLSIQEFKYVLDSVQDGKMAYERLRGYLKENNLSVQVGLEGGFSPEGVDNKMALSILKNLNPTFKIALDIARSSSKADINLREVVENFNIFSLEDPFKEEEWDLWVDFMRHYGEEILIIGDDLTTTNVGRIKRAVKLKACSAVIIKPNQIGTISETVDALRYSQEHNLKTVVSHRSGETNDTFIADLAVGCLADYVKFGAPSRGERVAKYNRLLEIEREI